VDTRLDKYLALAVMAIGFFMIFIGVPEWVITPKAVRIPVLSPAFWPNILAWILVLLGGGLLIQSLRPGAGDKAASGEPGPLRRAVAAGTIGRLAILGLLLVAYALSISYLGMVWASMVAFAVLLVVVRTPHPIIGAAAAVGMPLALYGFFQHLAAVSIPQGVLVTLP